MKITYDDLKSSPFAKDNVAPEEVAIWLDMHGLCNANAISHMLNIIEKNWHTAFDYVYFSVPILNAFQHTIMNSSSYASDIILTNMFVAVCVTRCLSLNECKKLLKTTIKNENRCRNTYLSMSRKHCIYNRQLLDWIDIYGELRERLEDYIKCCNDASSTVGAS